MSDPFDPTDDYDLDVEGSRMPLLEHLRELRRRLIIGGVALGIGMTLGMIVAQPVFAFLTAPIRLLLDGGQTYPDIDALYLWVTQPIRAIFPTSITEVQVQGTLALTSSPMEGVYTWLRVALLTGALIASPVVAYQGWQFVAPGLYATERKVVIPLTIVSTFLFMAGMAFAYTVMLPIAFPFFLTVLKVEAVLSVEGYLSTLVRMLLAFGICFQLPVVVWFGARLGLIDHRDLIKGFRYAIVAMFTISAIITPPDVLTQVILGVPLTLLYIVSIGVAWFWTTKGQDEGLIEGS